MNAIIIEDEKLAAEYLRRLIYRYDPGIQVIFEADSVKKTVQWFDAGGKPDLAFFDIQLADGLSFEIFDRTTVACPVIFTTAYNEYALRAFKVNSIDYLLKPIDQADLKKAIDKFRTGWLRESPDSTARRLDTIDRLLHQFTKTYKSRFIVKVGEHLRPVTVEEILYFYSLDKNTFFATAENRHYPVDYSLEYMEEILDPERFFRINRKYMISLPAILDIVSYSNSRLKIRLRHSADEDVIVSRERVSEFREWLDR
jgi:DNA-binding LytR/AlgR family response regulator